jgi:putative FmdB family regulatory protein
MPLYQYECDHCGDAFQEFLPIEEYRRTLPCPCCGMDAQRVLGCQLPATMGKEWVSDALGVMPSQALEAQEDADSMGVDVTFDKAGPDAGIARFRTRQDRNRYMKAKGYFDKDAGYSDPN